MMHCTSSKEHLTSRACHVYHAWFCQATLLSSAAAARSAVHVLASCFVKQPKSTSKQTGPDFLKMLQHGHPATFQDAYGLNKHVYKQLLCKLCLHSGLVDSKHIMADEQLSIFLYICTSGLSIQKAALNLQRSIDSILK